MVSPHQSSHSIHTWVFVKSPALAILNYPTICRSASNGKEAWKVSIIYTANKDWLFNHWMVTLVAEKLRKQQLYEKFILVLEANYISNLSPNHTLYNWQPNICEGSRHYTHKLLTSKLFCGYTLSQMFKIMVVIAYSLIHAGAFLSKIFSAWLLYHGCEMSWKLLPSFVMQLQYTLCLGQLLLMKVTTW